MLGYFGGTLTLPGIAGLVLTLGMAIDSSILIYEKIKEELRQGVTLKKAIDAGFSGAFVVILMRTLLHSLWALFCIISVLAQFKDLL